MIIKKSPKEGIAARGYGNPNKAWLIKGIQSRIKAIEAFCAEIDIRCEQIEQLITDLHEKELGVKTTTSGY